MLTWKFASNKKLFINIIIIIIIIIVIIILLLLLLLLLFYYQHIFKATPNSAYQTFGLHLIEVKNNGKTLVELTKRWGGRGRLIGSDRLMEA